MMMQQIFDHMLGFNLTTINGKVKFNHEKRSLTSQTLSLFSRDHQFKSHKPQGYWTLTNLKACKINRGTRRLARDTPVNVKKKKNYTLIHGIS
jgi:hypothetical protein